MIGDGIGDNADDDRDGDGFSNAIELAAGTDDRDKTSFPDEEGPVLDFVKWIDGPALQGMVYDDGMGVESVWLNAPDGDFCRGTLVYTGHFRIDCPQMQNSPRWQLVAEDKAGNKTVQWVDIPDAD